MAKKAAPASTPPASAPAKPKRRKAENIKRRKRGAPPPHKFAGKCIIREVRGVKREFCFNDKGWIKSNRAVGKD